MTKNELLKKIKNKETIYSIEYGEVYEIDLGSKEHEYQVKYNDHYDCDMLYETDTGKDTYDIFNLCNLYDSEEQAYYMLDEIYGED